MKNGNWNDKGWAVMGKNGGIKAVFRSKHKAKQALELLWYIPEGRIERVDLRTPEEKEIEIRTIETKIIKL